MIVGEKCASLVLQMLQGIVHGQMNKI